MNHTEFQELIKTKGAELYRDMPWRQDTNPYYVLVSELMLQQTQVARVIPKFETFVARLPTVGSLAEAPLSDVLKLWSGLGYNRRAKYLHQAAQHLMAEHAGRVPEDIDAIQRLPGVGKATAGAVMAYAFNRPILFIETNVRTVYIHCFFEPDERVSDGQLLPLIEATIDMKNPRQFYWALMDYGTWLKQVKGSAVNKQSLHYKKQSTFRGSVREVRGAIVRALSREDMTLTALEGAVNASERFSPALDGLIKDGLVVRTGTLFHLTR